MLTASTSTRSTTRTVLRFPLGSGSPSRTASSSRAGSSRASPSTRAKDGRTSSSSRLAGLDRFSREARDMRRYLFSATVEAELDKQGRVTLPAGLIGEGGASAATSSSPEPGTTSRSGTARPGASRSKTSRGGRTLLRNALQHETADHVPVLAEEVRELLAVKPGETVIDGTFGAGGHAELLAADLGGQGALHRRRPRRDACARTSSASSARPGFRHAFCAATSPSSSASSPTTTSGPTRSCSTSACRACRSIAPSADSPTRPMHRSTCAWTSRRPARPRRSSTS